MTARKACQELTVSVPWGKIAIKKWPRLIQTFERTEVLPPNHLNLKKPFVCCHGWLDNANSFDTMIPLIQERYPLSEFYCIDFPGHGLSDHYATSKKDLKN